MSYLPQDIYVVSWYLTITCRFYLSVKRDKNRHHNKGTEEHG